MCMNIIQAARDGAATAAFQFHRKNLSVLVCIRGYPEIAGLPHPFQKMLSIDFDSVPERIAAGKLAPIYDGHTLTCYCRRYLLPCHHAFHLDSEVNILTPDKWVLYLSLFEESGYEVHETVDLSKWQWEKPANGGSKEFLNYERFNSCRVSFMMSLN
jgi:hypothetical protein